MNLKITITVIAGIIFIFYFFSRETNKKPSEEPKVEIPSWYLTTPQETISSGRVKNPANSPTTDTQKFIPEGFRGPTEEPHIIGPKSDPPAY